jgi:hypothetical protein
MRYLIGLTVALALIGLGSRFSSQAALLDRDIRQVLIQEQRAGSLPPDLQEANFLIADLLEMDGREGEWHLPGELYQRLLIGRRLSVSAHIWSPLVVVGCLAIAALVGRATKSKR